MAQQIKQPSSREAVLLAILINGPKYGLEVRDTFQKRTGKPLPLGSLYVTLDRMEAKGFLKSKLTESVHPRGGNRRKEYRITGMGAQVLGAFELALNSAQKGLRDAI